MKEEAPPVEEPKVEEAKAEEPKEETEAQALLDSFQIYRSWFIIYESLSN